MSAEFEVTGLFYEINGYKLRKYLDIKRISSASHKPDLMVVMMNPGSSSPFNDVDGDASPTQAKPDTTQYQIMKVMDAASFNYARILNLSDLRTPDSSKLYRFVKSDEVKSVDHSIFSSNRKKELNKLFIKGVPVIFAWGVNKALVPLAKQAINALSVSQPLGKLKEGTNYSYYHPLPQTYSKQVEWVQHVTSQWCSAQQAGLDSLHCVSAAAH